MPRFYSDAGIATIFALAAMSVAATWATVTIIPSALVVVLFLLSFFWGILRLSDFVVMVLPCLLPLMFVQVPGFSRSGLAVVLLAAVIGAAIGLGRLKILPRWPLPRLVIAGWFWILAAEIISAIIGGGPEVITSVAIRIVRTTIFLMAVLAISRGLDIPKIAMGWALFGGLGLAPAILLQSKYGTVLAVRDLAETSIGTVLGSSAIIAAWGTFAVASAWSIIGFGKERAKGWTWFFVLIAMVFGIVAFYSGRRQVLVAFAGSAILFQVSQRGRRMIVTGLIICMIFAASYLAPPIQEFLASRASVFSEINQRPGNTGYMPIYRAGINAFLAHPLTGLGLGNYSLQTASEGVWMAGAIGVGAAPHNSIIRVFAETGLMGGIGVVLLLVGIVALGIRAWRQLRVSGGGFVALVASGLGGLVIAGLSVMLIDDVGYCFVLGEFVGLCAYVVREDPARRADIGAASWPNEATLSRAGLRT